MSENRKQYRRRLTAYLLRHKARGFKAQIYCAVGVQPWAAPDCFLRCEPWGYSGFVS